MLMGFYGTLKDGLYGRGLASGVRRVGSASIPTTLYDLGAFPGAVMGSGTTLIDIFYIPDDLIDETLQRLDAYEGYDEASPDTSLYVRQTIPVRLAEEPMVQLVEVYIYNQSVVGFPVIVGGDWLAYRKEKEKEGHVVYQN